MHQPAAPSLWTEAPLSAIPQRARLIDSILGGASRHQPATTEARLQFPFSGEHRIARANHRHAQQQQQQPARRHVSSSSGRRNCHRRVSLIASADSPCRLFTHCASLNPSSAGIIGLDVALVLAERGLGPYITVIAEHLPGDTAVTYTSPW